MRSPSSARLSSTGPDGFHLPTTWWPCTACHRLRQVHSLPLWLLSGLGLLLGLGFAIVVSLQYEPMLAGDDEVGYSAALATIGSAFLAGAGLGVDPGTSSPRTPQWPWRKRMLAATILGTVPPALVVAVTLGVSLARGGTGTPDLRLLADASLAGVLSVIAGMAVGRLTRSRVITPVAAVFWIVSSFIVYDGPVLSVQWLTPMLMTTHRTFGFGFLPDPWWPHLGYLAGITVLLGAVLAVTDRGQDRPKWTPTLAVGVAGLLLAGSGAVALVGVPDAVIVLGPQPDQQHVVRDGLAGLTNAFANFGTRDDVYPGDDRATTCQGGVPRVCIYPEYGQRVAELTQADMAPVARLFTGFPDVPTFARMVPIHSGSRGCGQREVQLPAYGRALRASDRSSFADEYLVCAVGLDQHRLHELDPERRPSAQLAVIIWASGITGNQVPLGVYAYDLWRYPGDLHDPTVRAAHAMGNLSTDEVLRKLRPVWARLRAGTLTINELPGQHP